MPRPSGTPTAPAELCLLSSLPPTHAVDPPRVRLVGRVIGYDPHRALALIADGPHGLLVDLTLVLHRLARGATPPRVRDRVMLVGTLEVVECCTPLPRIDPSLPPTAATAPEVDPRVVLHAEQMQLCEELDMEGWAEAVHAVREQAAR